MKKSVFIDLKRLLQGKLGLAVLIIAPVVILLSFSAVIAPVFFNTGNEFTVALLCEDKDPFTASVIESLVKTEQSHAVMKLSYVDTLAEGQDLLANNGAACLIHIPEGFQDNLLTGNKSAITLYENTAQPLASAIVKDVLSSGVALVNEAQTGVNALYNALQGKIPPEDVQKAYTDTSKAFLLQALNKSAVFKTETVSPLGALQPVEYYAAALLIIFLSLSALGLYATTASDISNGVYFRHIAAGRGLFAIAMPRVLSGALFVFLQGLPLLILYMPICITSFAYGGSIPLMPVSLLALSFLVSSFAYFLGTALPGNKIKTVFLILAALLLIGGTVIPSSYFGTFSPVIAYTPFFAALKMIFGAFFFFQQGEFALPCLTTLFYALLFLAGGILFAKRRI